MANIKISQLQSISSNLTGNSLLPIVSTNNSLSTDKITVNQLANFILGNAGVLFANADIALASYNVVNAAQPNITSVGTLSNITVTGTSNLGFQNNVKILGGSNGQVLTTYGNGTLYWTLGVQGSNSVLWTNAPSTNTSAGTAGQAAYDSGGNLYICVSTNTWAKFTGTTSW